ncbi:MAG: tryptophan-rich sensory protein [Clostridiaceae bacterium]|jgi:hypothetical protein|nr:tryptophan-rich sensory protein [Clostridiaceae bacterium]
MEDSTVGNFTKVHTTVTFIVMIIVNVLANIIPFNGLTTGEISDLYQNLFAPAPLTFSVWTVIYILLAGYILYQYGFLSNRDSSFSKDLIEKIAIPFTISSMANTGWMFVWHYKSIGISLVLMLIILICLIVINLHTSKAELSTREKIFIRLPFSVYFGWITVATIANIATFYVSLGGNGYNRLLTVAVLVVGLLISGLIMFKNLNLGYGIAVIWAYIGILVKHTSKSGFKGEYPLIILMLILCIIVLLIAEVYIVVTDKEKLKSFKLFRKKAQ